MAGLVIEGDPGGWSDLGHSLMSLSARLETCLSDADAFGAQALGRTWYGPAAAAFAAHWASRRPRHEELAMLARRAGQALLAYATALGDLRAQAASLENYWCGCGLYLTASGENFLLPPGIAQLPPPAQTSLHEALAHAAAGTGRLDAGCAAEGAGLAAALSPVITILEELAGAAGTSLLASAGHDLRRAVTDPAKALDVAAQVAADRADNATMLASQLGYYLRKGTAGERSAAGMLLPQAGADAARYARYARWLREGSTVLAVGGVGWEVWQTQRQRGWAASLETHSGDIASTALSLGAGSALFDVAAGAIAAVGAPEILVGVGAAVAVGALAVGVGTTVQAVVDHRKAIGHFVDSLL